MTFDMQHHANTSWLLNAVAIVLAATAAIRAHAEIGLTLIPVEDTVEVGETIEIEVYVVSDSSEDQLLAAAEMIFTWETEQMQLLGNHQDGAVELLSSGFPTTHPSDLNEAEPPQDGIAVYMAWAPLGEPVAATPSGTLLTTIEFEALAEASDSPIDIVPAVGDPEDPLAITIVYDGTTPNTDVTGQLIDTSITIVSPCPGDVNRDGVVNVDDLLIVLNNWGDCDDPNDCPADVTGTGVIDVDDLLIVLNSWGICPR